MSLKVLELEAFGMKQTETREVRDVDSKQKVGGGFWAEAHSWGVSEHREQKGAGVGAQTTLIRKPTKETYKNVSKPFSK